MKLRHIETLKSDQISGKKILLRVDFNVPMKNGVITDQTRILKSLPTIKYLMNHGGAVVIIAHLGRPNGKVNSEMSLRPIADHLANLLSSDVKFEKNCIGNKAHNSKTTLGKGELLLLENLRFHPEEVSEDQNKRNSFAKQLSQGCDLYVNDAFGTSHRRHASIVDCAQILPNYVGYLLKQEIDMLEKVLRRPERPVVAIIGGSKISSKLAIIENMMKKVDHILIGGAMAYTFLKSRLVNTGNSIVEREFLSKAFQIIDKAAFRQVGFHLPEDHIATTEFSENAKIKKFKGGIPDNWMGMDIGPKTILKYKKIILKAKTVLWNGPMGVFEMNNFAEGTNAIAKAVAKVNGTTIIGGGDSVYAIEKAEVAHQVTHLSTGGGATLEYLEGKLLPGLEVLCNET